MKISIIGTGRMAKGLVKVFADNADHVDEILWNSRNIDKVKQIIRENGYKNVVPATQEESFKADVIIHTLWFKDVITWVNKYKDELSGKILVDISNPFNEDFSDFTTDWGTSSAEEIQKNIPNTKVVGAFKNTYFAVFDSPIQKGLKSDVFVTSNHEDAKEIVMNLLNPLPFRIYDGGKLQNNRTIERITLFEREMAMRYNHYPNVSIRLFGNDH